MRSSFPAVAAALAVALAGCDTTFPWSSGTPPGGGRRISVSPGTLEFSGPAGGPAPAAKSAVLTVTGSVYLGVGRQGAAVATASLVQTSPTTADVVVTPSAPSTPGILSGTVTVVGCEDEYCTREVAGSPAVISVTYDVKANTLSVAPTTLAFDYLVGGPLPAPRSLQVSDTAGGAYAAATIPAAGDWLVLDRSSGTVPDTIAVSVDPSGKSPATYQGTVALTSDGGARSVPVTLTVRRPDLHVAPAALAFDAVQGQAATPAAKDVTLSTDGSVPVAFTTSIDYGAGPTGWLSVPASGDAPLVLQTRPATTALAFGQHAATVTITPGNGGPPVQVPVTYAISAATVRAAPASAAFAVTAATVPAGLTQGVAVSSSGGTLAWDATTSAGWLSVSPAAGTTASAPVLSLSLVPAELANLANGVHSTEVVLAYTDSAGAPRELRVPVALDLGLPRPSLVAPHVEVAGTSAEVVVRGSGLGGVQEVRFGDTAATAVTAVSATEVRATHPALSAGTFQVTVPNGLGLDLGTQSGTQLVVVEPAKRTAAWVASGGAKRKLVFDDARAAVYAATASTVERFRESNGWAREVLALATVRDVALSPDGARLVVVAGANVWEIDPDAFVLPAQPATTLTGWDASADWRIAFANDGAGILAAERTGSGNLGDVDCRKYDYTRKTAAMLPPCSYYRGAVGGSADGRRVVAAGTGVSPAQAVGHYDASAGAFQLSLTAVGCTRIALDRTGARMVLASEYYSGSDVWIHDASYAQLGRLPSGTRALISRDGTRAHAWDFSTSKVRAFDLSADPVAGIYPELGTAGGTAPAANPGLGVELALSADARTLVLAGDQYLVIQPLP